MKMIFYFSFFLFGISPVLKADILKCRFTIFGEPIEKYFVEEKIDNDGWAVINQTVNSANFKNIAIMAIVRKNIIDFMRIDDYNLNVYAISDTDEVWNPLSEPSSYSRAISLHANEIMYSLTCKIIPGL